MPRRASPRSAPRRTEAPRRPGVPQASPRWRRAPSWWAWGLVVAAGLGMLVGLRLLGPEDAGRLRARAEAAAEAGRWDEALLLWRRINATPAASGPTLLGEGRACLALGRAAQAERALRRAAGAAPGEAEAWLLLLEVLRVEDRALEARDLGWRAVEAVAPESLTEVLRELTLAALADAPDDVARNTLRRWVQADADDFEARVALLRRIGGDPRADDPDREARLADLAALLAAHPDHPGAREALATALADAGEWGRGREVLDGWPQGRRDGRYWRLLGRLELEHDRRPGRAVESLRAALDDFPQDWRTHYRLARALWISGREEEARREAEAVGRTRELLDPMALGPRLDAAFARLGEPDARRGLADLCARVGLSRLADAWGLAASRAAGRPPGGPGGGLGRALAPSPGP